MQIKELVNNLRLLFQLIVLFFLIRKYEHETLELIYTYLWERGLYCRSMLKIY